MLDPARAMRCSDEQVLLAETAAAFCRDHGSSAAVRHAIASEAGFDRALWDEMVGLGWSGIVVPERFGGSALTLAEVAVKSDTAPLARPRSVASKPVTSSLNVAVTWNGPECGEVAGVDSTSVGAVESTVISNGGPGGEVLPDRSVMVVVIE